MYRHLRQLLPTLVLPLCACGEATTMEDLTPWTLVEDLRIGSLDDAATALTTIGDVAIGEDGRIYIEQSREREVRVFDGGGAPVTVFGNRGEGPGEFATISGLGFLGDTLYVLDAQLRRISYFTASGELLGTETAAPRVEVGEPRFPEVLFRDGTGLSEAREARAGWAAWLRVARDGTPLDTLARFEIELPRTAAYGDGRVVIVAVSAPDEPLHRQSVDGAHTFIIERPFPETANDAVYRLTRVTLEGDTVWTRKRRFRPVPVPRAEHDSILAERQTANPSLSSIMDAASPYYPFRLPITGATVASDGAVWLRREVAPAATEVRWDILDSEGAGIGTTVLPADIRVVAIHDGAVYAAVSDALGVPYLVRYRVER